MSDTSNNGTSQEIEKVERSLVDSSARFPVLFLYGQALVWLIVATLLGFAASVKIHTPEFLSDCPWMTYGRVWPAYLNALIYGWASMAGLGTALWIMGRLCRASLRAPGVVICGSLLWSFGVTVGLLEILSGNSTGRALLEFSGTAATILFTAYLVIGVWGIVMFSHRRAGASFISVLFLLGAFLWFPWVYGAANLMVASPKLSGVLPAIVSAWYGQALINLWLGSLGLAAVYYFIPKVTGRPVSNYSLATLGFWALAFLGGWTGMTRLSGGPVPAWLVTVSIVATILMLIPVATVTVNYLCTLKGSFSMLRSSPTLRFVFVGALAWSLCNVLNVVLSLRSVERITHFTYAGAAQSQLAIYGFFTMTMFGAIYYIVPRLVGREWTSVSFINLHFWGAFSGMVLLVAALLAGGVVQGLAWNNASSPVVAVLQQTVPYLTGRSLAWLLLLFSHLAFLLHFCLMMVRLGRPGGEPTLFVSDEKEATL